MMLPGLRSQIDGLLKRAEVHEGHLLVGSNEPRPLRDCGTHCTVEEELRALILHQAVPRQEPLQADSLECLVVAAQCHSYNTAYVSKVLQEPHCLRPCPCLEEVIISKLYDIIFDTLHSRSDIILE
jgi:hypothetical protein